jgi:hypothetical protein
MKLLLWGCFGAVAEIPEIDTCCSSVYARTAGPDAVDGSEYVK